MYPYSPEPDYGPLILGTLISLAVLFFVIYGAVRWALHDDRVAAKRAQALEAKWAEQPPESKKYVI